MRQGTVILRELRRRSGVTQTELAALEDVSQAYVHAVESGKLGSGTDHFIGMLDKLGYALIVIPKTDLRYHRQND